MQYTSYYISKLLPSIKGNYDLAISFQGVPFYMKKVNAKKKMAWIHTDYAILDPDKKMDLKAYQLVDYVVTVSDECKEALDKIYPVLKNKSIMIENIISKSYVFNQAAMKIDKHDKNILKEDCISLLSIGRFCEAKNFDNIPEICKYIINSGIDVQWNIIGFGGDEELIKSKIKKYKVENYVHILGKKDNPYPYIKVCDIYIQPSRYEGKAVTVREAQILNKPVIITNYATSKSQLIDGYDGIIVSIDNKSCAKEIIEVIENLKLCDQLIENTKKNDYTNSQEVNKVYKILEEIV